MRKVCERVGDGDRKREGAMEEKEQEKGRETEWQGDIKQK